MYDTIIIGAGSAGCVLANRLSADPARRVLLLEAGGPAPQAAAIPSDWTTMFNTDVDWGYHTEPQPGCRGRRIFWPRGRMIGGSGSLNAMIYMRGLASDYDGWAAMAAPAGAGTMCVRFSCRRKATAASVAIRITAPPGRCP